MGDERAPVLGVLRAVLGAHRHAQDEGHLEQTGAHRLPLGHLVEDLVTGAAQEVAVHELDDRAATGHRVADAGAHDRGLGDGRVEEATVGQGLGQAAVDGEGAAPVAVFLAPCGHRRVGLEAVQHRLEEAVTELVHAHLGDGLAVLIDGGAHLLGQGLDARVVLEVDLGGRVVEGLDLLVGEHDGVDVAVRDARGGLVVDGQLEDLDQLVGQRGRVAVDLVLRGQAVGDQQVRVFLDAVDLLPQLDLFLRAVRGSVRRGVAGEAVGDGVHEDGAAALLEDLLLAGGRIRDGQRVEAVDALGVHGLGVEGRAHTGEDLISHGLAEGLAAHAVEVVEEVEQDRRVAAVLLAPQRAELVHGREVHGLPHGATGQGGVTDVGDDDAGLAVDALEQGRAVGDRGGAADDGVVRVGAKGQEEGVHRAAQAAVEAGLAGKDLGEGAEEDEVLGEVLRVLVVDLLGVGEGLAAEEALHDALELALVHLVHGRVALGEDLAVGAVGAEDEVLGLQHKALTDVGALLADAQVSGAAVVVLDAFPLAGLLDGVEHRLEGAHDDHVVEHLDHALFAVAGEFGLTVEGVLVDGHVGELHVPGATHLVGVDDKRLSHCSTLP